MKILFPLVLSLLFLNSSGDPMPEIRFYGVQIRVHNMEQAVDFYSKRLGFSISEQMHFPNQLSLKTNSFPLELVLVKEENNTNYKQEAHAKVSFLANDLLPTIDRLRSVGVPFQEKELSKNGVGVHIPFQDPSGNQHTIIEVQIRTVPSFEEPRIYNTGFNVVDMEAAASFYVEKLGFEVFSEDYLPAALPLKHSDNSFAFMLHYKNEMQQARPSYPKQAQTLLMFETKQLERSIAILKTKGITFLSDEIQSNSRGKYIAFKDPSGNISELWEFDNK